MTPKDDDEAPPSPEQLKKDKEMIAKLQNRRKEELEKSKPGKIMDKEKASELFEERLKRQKK
ncbi:MAG: hypothetical protein WED05_06710 [Candidatus Atabeyarchaeum deiterrae]